MNRATTLSMCLGLLLHLSVHAQDPRLAFHQKTKAKPLLFKSLPEKIQVSSAELQKLMTLPIGEPFNIQLSSQLWLKGKIVEKIQQTAGSISINIRAENWQNALLNINFRLLADNSLGIQCRMLHPRYGDVLVLNKERNQFYFSKRAQHLYMPE